MKQLQGLPQNINKPIIGKITFDKKKLFQSKSDYILISDNNDLTGYSAILSGETPKNLKFNSRIVHSVNDIKTLCEGDIVVIYPEGNINVVYEINTIHNALFLTNRCNANCIMCPQPPNNNIIDNYDEVLKILSLINKEAKHIGITGGEPTLLGNKLVNIIEILKTNFSKTSVTLLTNAMILSDLEYTKKIAEINHPDLLIDVPLYSDTDTEHNRIIRAKGFHKTIKGLYNLALLNQKVGIRIVIHKMNYKRLPQIAEFIYRNFPFAYHIAFMQMEPTGFAKDNLDELWIDPYDYNTQLEETIYYLCNTDMNVSIYNSQLCILPESLRKFARQSISTWKNIYLKVCNNCRMMNNCPGFFASSLNVHSNHIIPIKYVENC